MASRSSHSASAFASVPTTICRDPGFPSAAGARRCGSATVICAAPSNTRSTMNASASAYSRHHALRQSVPAHGVSGPGVVRAVQQRDTAPRRYYQGWQRCGTTNAHRGSPPDGARSPQVVDGGPPGLRLAFAGTYFARHDVVRIAARLDPFESEHEVRPCYTMRRCLWRRNDRSGSSGRPRIAE